MSSDYGIDLAWDGDLVLHREVTGAELVRQAVHVTLITKRGTVIDALDFGRDLRELFHTAHSPEALAAIPGQIRFALERDDRLAFVEVDAFFAASKLTVKLRGQTASQELFDLVLATDGVTVEKLARGF